MLESDAAMLHAQKMANGEVEYQAAVRQSNDKGWKDEFVLIYKFKRTMQEQLDALVQTLANGGVDSMDEYKYIIGKIHAIDLMNQELSNLLEPKEPNNDDDKVTRIRR
jgi:hypothetical protein